MDEGFGNSASGLHDSSERNPTHFESTIARNVYLLSLHIRNATTGMMKELGYGKGNRYDPDEEIGVADQSYLP